MHLAKSLKLDTFSPSFCYELLETVSYNSLVESNIIPVAVVIAPATIPGDTGTFKFIVNVSSPSTRSSFLTVIFTISLFVPAMIVAVCGVGLKSMPPVGKY